MRIFKKKREDRKSFDRLGDDSANFIKVSSPHRQHDQEGDSNSTSFTSCSGNQNQNQPMGKSNLKSSARTEKSATSASTSSVKASPKTLSASTRPSKIQSRSLSSGSHHILTTSPSISKPPPISFPRLSKGLPPFDYESSDNLNTSNFLSQPVRSNWDVQDTKLNPIPPMHPPIPPHCTTFIGDTTATPSIISSRISECLRKRSMAVEFDSDAATPTATCLNESGVLFVICLYRGGKGEEIKKQDMSQNRILSLGNTSNGSRGEIMNHSLHSRSAENSGSMSTSVTTSQPDFSHGVIVECSRIRGDVVSFHRDCRAILSSARGDSDGLNDRRSKKVALLNSPIGFNSKRGRSKKSFGMLNSDDIRNMEEDRIPRLIDVRGLNRIGSGKREENTSQTFKALGNALNLLEKDRLDARLLGMESLVMLTEKRSSGLIGAYLSSLSVLGSPNISRRWDDVKTPEEEKNIRALSRLHEMVRSVVVGNFSQGLRQPHMMAEEDVESVEEEFDIVAEFNTKLRRCALQVLTNAMCNVANHHDDFPLLPKPSCDAFMTAEFLEVISDDLSGAARPPMATLGSAHEATFAARILHLLASYSTEGFYFVHGAVVGDPPRSLNGLLDRARMAGSACHRAMELESQLAQSAIGGKMSGE